MPFKAVKRHCQNVAGPFLPPTAGATRSLPVFLHSAAGLLACRILLTGCALARRQPTATTKPCKGSSAHLPKAAVRHWHKA